MYFVYIMTNVHNTTLYVGVTNDLMRRVYEHKHEVNKGFTQQYQLHKLIYFETFFVVEDAIAREKQLKKLSRKNKKKLIGEANPTWEDIPCE